MPFKDKQARSSYNKLYRKLNKVFIERRKRLYWIWQRLTVLRHYSKSNTPTCRCCGESTYAFLSLDHINGGGTQHRKNLGSKYILSDLIGRGFPSGYQVLCHNCNQAKGFYGKCPHQWSKAEKKEFNQILLDASALQVKQRQPRIVS